MKAPTLSLAGVLLIAVGLRAGDQKLPRTPSELNRWYAEPPVGQNAATFFLQGMSNLNLSYSDFRDPNLPWLGRAPLPQLNKPVPEAMNRAVAWLLERNESVVPCLEAGAKYEQSRYPVDLTRGLEERLYHLTYVLQTRTVLAVRTLALADAGKGKEAVEALLLSLALERSLESEPIRASEHVRFCCIAEAVESLEQLVNRYALTPAVLDNLQTNLSRTDRQEAITGFWRGVVGEHVLLDSLFDLPEQKQFEALRMFPEMPRAEIDAAKRYSASADKAFTDETSEQILAAWREPFPSRIRAVGQICTSRLARATNDHFLVAAILSRRALRTATEESGYIVYLRMAQVATALERFRSSGSKRYPANLAELVPRYLAAVPLEPLDGERMRYYTQGDGYLLWSPQLEIAHGGATGATGEHITFRVVTPPH